MSRVLRAAVPADFARVGPPSKYPPAAHLWDDTMNASSVMVQTSVGTIPNLPLLRCGRYRSLTKEVLTWYGVGLQRSDLVGMSRYLLLALAASSLVVGCDSGSSNVSIPPTPTPSPTPSFQLVSANWLCTAYNATGLCTGLAIHGVFRNAGGPGSVAVQFTNTTSSGSYVVCVAAIPETPANAVSEATCQASGYFGDRIGAISAQRE